MSDQQLPPVDWVKNNILLDIQMGMIQQGYKNMPSEGCFEIHQPEFGQREAFLWRFATEDWQWSTRGETNIRLVMARPALKHGTPECWAEKMAEARAAIEEALIRGRDHGWPSLGKEKSA